MLPRLEAEERLAAIEAAALAAGNVEHGEQRRAIERLQRRASPGTRARKASAQDLAGMGIGMRVAEPEGDS